MLKIISIFISLALMFGCSSNTVHDKQVLAVKSEARASYAGVNNIDVVVTPISSSEPVHPPWVVDPGSVYNYPVGVACEEFIGQSYQGKIDARIKALDVARLQLFVKLNGDQRISAHEKYVGNTASEQKAIEYTIKTHSRGMLAANKKINESVIDIGGRRELCVAVGLLSS